MKPLGLPFAARVCLMIAADTLNRQARPLARRDVDGVRGLACLLMREVEASWPDITLEIYGRRTGHSSAISAASRWRDTNEGIFATRRFTQLIESERRPLC